MFTDRKDAAIKLARALGKYRGQHAIVLGIPRGVTEIAYYVALELNAELSLIVTRKLGYPENPETAFGSLAEDGTIYLPDEIPASLSEKDMDMLIETEWKEIQRRIALLRKGKPLPELKDRIVIIVDDGIATGATLLGAVSMCRKKRPRKIVVATPVASEAMEFELESMVDDVVILEKRRDFHAVGESYQDFKNLTDEQTINFIDAWNERLKEHNVRRKIV